MNLISWAVRRPAVVWASAATLLLAGGISFTKLALATRTTVELPQLSIGVGWPGASAELIETYLTSPIEAAIQGVRGVRRSRSQSRDDFANITVELEAKADVQLARLSIHERLELLRMDFPPGASAPTVSNYVPQELDEPPLIRATLSGPYTPGTLQKIMLEEMSPRVSAVPGVAPPSVAGGTELGVAVTYDPSFLRQIGLSPQLVSDALAGSRLVRAMGKERLGGTQREVVMRDQPAAIEQLGELPIQGPGRRVFRLRDIATIRTDEDAQGRFFRINGEPAVAMSISRLPGADAIKTAQEIRRTLDELGARLPTGTRIRVGTDESIDLAAELKDLFLRGGIAFAAVMLVLALALRNARAVALVMASAAVAIAGTAFGLYVLDIPANMLTLAGLGMGVGILVQDGLIVVNRLGTAPDTMDGRAEAGRKIFPAVLGATLTTAVVLLPFLYLQGNARAAFFPFAAAFALALGWSIVAAVVMVPALGAGHGLRARRWPRIERVYEIALVRLIRWRWITLAASVVLLAGLSYGFHKKVTRFAFGGFGQERTTLGAYISFPRGSDPESLDRAMQELERIVLGHSEVEEVVAQGSASGAGMNVIFTRAGGLTAVPLELEEQLTSRAVFIGGASVSVRGQGPGFSSGLGSVSLANFRVRILGYSYEGVQRVALDLKERLERVARVKSVSINAGSFFGQDRSFMVTLEPNRGAMARFGVTAQQLAQAVAREVRGPVGTIYIEIAGDEMPVTVKATGARERTLEELRDALVPTPTGVSVRIADLATVSERETLGTISREDQQYVRILSYEFRGPTKLARRTHDAFMKSISVPAGYSVSDARMNFGFTEDDSEQGLWLVFAVGVTLVVLAVAMVFDSTWAALIVFLTLPISVGGVMAAFWIAHAPFTREAAVGVIVVVGLAVHQAILLVDAALHRRRRNLAAGRGGGLSVLQVLHAARDRSGMIMLVTVSTMASLIPLAVGTPTGSLFGAIALATAGGTVAGTVGAMLVMPAMLVAKRKKRQH